MKRLLAITVCTILAACGGTTVIDTNNSEQVAEMKNTMQLEYRDWEKAATNMTQSMLNSGAFAKIKNPVITTANIKNDIGQKNTRDTGQFWQGTDCNKLFRRRRDRKFCTHIAW